MRRAGVSRDQEHDRGPPPDFHHRNDTTIRHIVGCFLALRLEVDQQRRLDERGDEVAWPDLMRDLDQVKAVDLTLDGARYRLRTELPGKAAAAFAAAGVPPPRLVAPISERAPTCSAERKTAPPNPRTRSSS